MLVTVVVVVAVDANIASFTIEIPIVHAHQLANYTGLFEL